MNRMTGLPMFLLLLALSMAASAQQSVAKVEIEVRDARTGEVLEARVTVDGDDIEGEYVLPPGSESSLLLDVRADAGSGYYPRTMTLFLEAADRRDLRFNIHLAPRNPSAIHNRRSVAAATPFLTPLHVDRAVALLEAVVAETSPTVRNTQFGVFLNFNLWRAYFINCTRRFVDHCTDATTLGAELLAMLPQKKALFEAERIPVAELQRADATLADHAYRLSYQRAKWNLKRNHPEDAAEQLEVLLRAVTDDPKLLDRLRIRKEDITLLLDRARRASATP